MNTITIIGAGSWGITLAVHLARKGYKTALWEFQPDVAERLSQERESADFLPGIRIPDDIMISSHLEEIVPDASELLVFVVPSHVLREVAAKVSPHITTSPVIVSGIKGIEIGTHKRMSEILREELPATVRNRIATLSGPSHAEEVSRDIPTSVVAASDDQRIAENVQEIFFSPRFRVYTNMDMIGVELAGALKNIIAIAAGISDGLGFGDNAMGALLTRGLAEITRLGLAMGAQAHTFSGLAGIGDLITTCMSRHSRNRYVGVEIGKGKSLAQVQEEMVMVAEGVMTTKAGHSLSTTYGVEMPITNEVYAVLFENKNPAQAVEDLMTRTAKAEVW